jgi:hypothetical protein
MLLQNTAILNQYPVNYRGAGGALPRPIWDRSQTLNAFSGLSTQKAAIPAGYLAPGAWQLPRQGGGLSSFKFISGSSDLTAAITDGRYLVAAFAGTSDLTGTAQLIVSAAAALSGTGTLDGNLLASLNGAATLAGSGDIAGALTAIGHFASALSGSGALSGPLTATGAMAATIAVGAQQALTAIDIASEVLDAQMVETGLTVRETLRLVVAALAGKVSESGSTVTIRNAVADSADRIVATVDSNGNRTAITYGLGG